MKSKEKNLNICPKCGSINVKVDMLSQGLTSMGSGNQTYLCIKCGFNGNLFPQIQESKVKKFQNKFKKNENYIRY